jgi:hypothetical protein
MATLPFGTRIAQLQRAATGRVPQGIRTDNGVPFASAHALYGLRKLAVWWLRLGIQIQRITPGHPQQNGRHERMHLKLGATKPAAANVLQQQARFDTFVEEYNRAVSMDVLHFRARILVAPSDVRVALEELMRCQQSADHRRDAVPAAPAATL